MEKFVKILKYWLPVGLWAGTIAYLSGIAGLSSDMTVFWDVFWRKLFHAGEFGLLNLLLWRALFFGDRVNFKKSLWTSFILTVLYAVSDELHQYFVPSRQCRWQDMAQDSLGAIFISGLLYLWQRLKNKGN
ncbi:MAG TPA: VanZ family protein [Candidatus Portnoybacteria bacterium]|nr:VanZ family protein [Candidatus Portnoybacteria bacterium]